MVNLQLTGKKSKNIHINCKSNNENRKEQHQYNGKLFSADRERNAKIHAIALRKVYFLWRITIKKYDRLTATIRALPRKKADVSWGRGF